MTNTWPTQAPYIMQNMEHAVPSTSLYCPLQHDDDIRILDLAPGNIQDPLVGSLRTVSLTTDAPSYFAVSYVWGTKFYNKPIVINGQALKVTKNLSKALRRIRDHDSTRSIWVDAMCINQSSVSEKSKQIPLIGRIYQEAKQVIIYLGSTSDRVVETRLVETEALAVNTDGFLSWQNEQGHLEYLEDRLKAPNGREELTLRLQVSPIPTGHGLFHDAHKILCLLASNTHFSDMPFYELVESTEDLFARTSAAWTDAMDALQFMLCQPWWSRVWVMQEALLPTRDPVVLFENMEIPLSTFIQAFRRFSQHSSSCCRNLIGMFVSALEEPRLISIVGDDFDTLAAKDSESMTLGKIAQIGSRHRASEPQDHIYGLLGLFNRSGTMGIQVDCSQPTSEIFALATRALLQESGSLHPLGAVGINRSVVRAFDESRQQPTLFRTPSWCIDFTRPTEERFLYGYSNRCSSRTCWKLKPSSFNLDADNKIKTQGIILGSVTGISQPTSLLDGNACKDDPSTSMLTVWKDIASFVEWAVSLGIPDDDMNLWACIDMIYNANDMLSVRPETMAEDAVMQFRDSWKASYIYNDSSGYEEVYCQPPLELAVRLKKPEKLNELRIFATSDKTTGVAFLDGLKIGDTIANIYTMPCVSVLRQAGHVFPENHVEWVGCAYLAGIEHIGCDQCDGEFKEIVIV